MTDCRLGGFESKILSRSVRRDEVPSSVWLDRARS